ncbi:MAG: hypothetical protein WBB01_10675 [Phormidesmis sp.]
MDALINLAMVTPTLSRETVLFTLISGLVIGAYGCSTEIGTAYVAKKLGINEAELPLKYFGLLVVVGGALAILFIIAIQSLGPSRAQIGAISDRAIDDLGIELYFGLSSLGAIATVIPLRLLSNYIATNQE